MQEKVFETMQNKKRSLIFYLLMVFVLLLTVGVKVNYHVDETLSYTLANGTGPSIYFEFEAGKKYEPSEEVFLDSMAVSSDQRFNYTNVWEKQAADVHPPLYYALLHTICSIFSESFSKWYAGAINIIFILLAFFFVRKLFFLLTNNRKFCDWLSIVFILSPGILNVASFFRMYAMAMCWVTMMAYLFVKQIGQRQTWRFYLAIFLVAVMGALTHYYCIVYTVFISSVYGIYLLLKRRWKDTGIFCLTMAAAGGVSLAIFPSMLSHMFFGGQHGTLAAANLANLDDYQTRIKAFFQFISQQMFGDILDYLLAAMVLIGVVLFIAWRKKQDTVCETIGLISVRYIVLVLPCVLYFLIVSKMASFVTDRYIMPIYAIAFVIIFCQLGAIVHSLFSKKNSIIILCVILSATLVGSWRNMNWIYLYRDTQGLLEKAEQYDHVDALSVFDIPWKAQASFLEMEEYKSITFIPYDQLELLDNLELKEKSELVVFIIGLDDHEGYLQQVMARAPKLTQYEKIGQFSYGSSYYLHGT